jgi:hypothetical protein
MALYRDTNALHPEMSKLLASHGGRTGEMVITAMAAVQLAKPAYAWVKERRLHGSFTITINGTDDIYDDLQEWLLERIPEPKRKALLLETKNRRDSMSQDHRIKLRYDGSREQTVQIDGHSIRVSLVKEDTPSNPQNTEDNWRKAFERITFTCTSTAARDVVVAMIDSLVAVKYAEDIRTPLLLPSRWGGDWNKRQDIEERTLDGVILKKGQIETLIDDIEWFMSTEDAYKRFGQPWHRGYLFHGIPGTGKTSVARALANHFDLPVYYLPLGDLDKDTDLMNLIQNVKPKSMLLIEDIDVYHAATSRDDENGNVSLASMLNSLDGVWTPHGLITVLTTNKRDDIDSALLRPGRIDMEQEFTAMDDYQARTLAEYCGIDSDVFDAEFVDKVIGKSPATMVELIRQRLRRV